MIRIMRKPTFCIGENKGADQLRSNCEADHAFVFSTGIVQSLFFLNPKCPACSYLLYLHSSVCVRPVKKNHIVGFLMPCYSIFRSMTMSCTLSPWRDEVKKWLTSRDGFSGCPTTRLDHRHTKWRMKMMGRSYQVRLTWRSWKLY